MTVLFHYRISATEEHSLVRYWRGCQGWEKSILEESIDTWQCINQLSKKYNGGTPCGWVFERIPGLGKISIFQESIDTQTKYRYMSVYESTIGNVQRGNIQRFDIRNTKSLQSVANT